MKTKKIIILQVYKFNKSKNITSKIKKIKIVKLFRKKKKKKNVNNKTFSEWQKPQRKRFIK